MTIIQCEYIVAVDTYKSFSTAAGHCFVTQPTLSMQIMKLEDELGVVLFDRKLKPVMTTDIGRKIIDQARIVLNEHRKIREIILQHRGEVAGTLRVGILPTVAPYLLPLFLRTFLDKYPKVRLYIDEMTTDEILARLRTDQLDMGILATPLESSSMQENQLYVEKMLIYLPEGHHLVSRKSISAGQLEGERLWLLREGHCFRNQVLRVCSLGSAEQGNLHLDSGSIETLIRIVDNNGGITIIPEMAALGIAPENRNRIRRFSGKEPGRQISIITHRSFLKNHTIDAVRKTIMEGLPSSMLKNSAAVIAA